MYINRASWTSVPPKSNKGADPTVGIGNYRQPVGIIVHSFPDSLTYFNNNPVELLNTRRLDDFNLKGYGDVAFNFAVPSNREGFYCCRGIISKGAASEEANDNYLSLLCMTGVTEEPTDQLLENLTECLSYIQTKYPDCKEVIPFSEIKRGGTAVPGEALESILQKNSWDLTHNPHRYLPPAPLPVGLTNVHVFDLIEALAFHGYYSSRNDGLYGPICENAVKNLQQDLSDKRIYPKNIDGFYGRWTRDCWNTLLARS